jgi:hypothetical protein
MCLDDELLIEETIYLNEYKYLKSFLHGVWENITFQDIRAVLKGAVSNTELPYFKLLIERLIQKPSYFTKKTERDLFLKECEVLRGQVRKYPPETTERAEKQKLVFAGIAMAEAAARKLKFDSNGDLID